MSRGLGSLQRQILESLDAARLAQEPYDRGVFRFKGADLTLAEGVYDLRCVSHYLSRRRQYGIGSRHQFWPMFSRAVHGLVQRQLLHPVRQVPLERVWVPHDRYHAWFVSWSPERPYFNWSSRQLRFVKRYDNLLTA